MTREACDLTGARRAEYTVCSYVSAVDDDEHGLHEGRLGAHVGCLER